MTIEAQYQVQDVINQTVELEYSDLTSGEAFNLIHIPAGATIVDGTYWVLTAFDSGTSDAVAVAFNSLTLVDDTDATAAVRTPFTLPTTTNSDNVSVSADTWLTVTWTGAGTAATAGKIRVSVNYVILGRGFAVQK